MEDHRRCWVRHSTPLWVFGIHSKREVLIKDDLLGRGTQSTYGLRCQVPQHGAQLPTDYSFQQPSIKPQCAHHDIAMMQIEGRSWTIPQINPEQMLKGIFDRNQGQVDQVTLTVYFLIFYFLILVVVLSKPWSLGQKVFHMYICIYIITAN